MTYHQAFDRLGNLVARRTRPDWQHRVIRWAALATIVVWGR